MWDLNMDWFHSKANVFHQILPILVQRCIGNSAIRTQKQQKEHFRLGGYGTLWRGGYPLRSGLSRRPWRGESAKKPQVLCLWIFTEQLWGGHRTGNNIIFHRKAKVLYSKWLNKSVFEQLLEQEPSASWAQYFLLKIYTPSIMEYRLPTPVLSAPLKYYVMFLLYLLHKYTC